MLIAAGGVCVAAVRRRQWRFEPCRGSGDDNERGICDAYEGCACLDADPKT